MDNPRGTKNQNITHWRGLQFAYTYLLQHWYDTPTYLDLTCYTEKDFVDFQNTCMATSLPYLLLPFLDGPLIPIPALASCVNVHPVPGDILASLAPVDDSDLATNHSAAMFVSIDDATIPSPDTVSIVSLTVPPASLDPVKDTIDDQNDPPAVIVNVKHISDTVYGTV